MLSPQRIGRQSGAIAARMRPIVIRLSTHWISLLAGTLILISPALYNGYPLVTSDTPTYIGSGFGGWVPVDRPITYGLFLRFSSLDLSLWFAVFAQSLILCYVLIECTREFFDDRVAYSLGLAVITFAALFTSAAWFSSQVMPDILTPIVILTVALFLFASHLTNFTKIILAAAFVFGCTAHLSNLVIVLILAIAFSIPYWIVRIRTRSPIPMGRRIALVWGLLLLAWVALPTIHLAFGGGFRASRGTHAFVMGRLIDAGVLKPYLDENCDSRPYKLCDYRDALSSSQELLHVRDSPLFKAGGWIATEPEYRDIIWRTLATPKYLALFLGDEILATLRQLAQIRIGDDLHTDAAAFVAKYIEPRSQFELNAFRDSRQNNRRRLPVFGLDFAAINNRWYVVLACSLLVLVALVSSGLYTRFEPRMWGFVLVAVAGIVANAAVTAGLSYVLARYETRAVWLLPVSLMILLAKERKVFMTQIKACLWPLA